MVDNLLPKQRCVTYVPEYPETTSLDVSGLPVCLAMRRGRVFERDASKAAKTRGLTQFVIFLTGLLSRLIVSVLMFY